MITTELISALSNIIKFFMGTLNNYTHLLPLLINVTSASGFKIWNEMLNINRKFCRRNPSKKKQESFLNILETEDSYFKPDEIMCYINSNTAKLKQIVVLQLKKYFYCALRYSRTFYLLQ